MCCSVWTVHFFVFVNLPITFTAHVQHAAAIAISTQHFFASFGAFQDVQNSLIRLCNMHVYTHKKPLSGASCGQCRSCKQCSLPSRRGLIWFGNPKLLCCTCYAASPHAALSACRTRERTYPINMKGKANRPKHANT